MFGSKLNKNFFERLQLTSISNNTTLIILLISVTLTVVIVIVITIAVYNSHARKENKSRLTDFEAKLEHRDKSERLSKSGKSHITSFKSV